MPVRLCGHSVSCSPVLYVPEECTAQQLGSDSARVRADVPRRTTIDVCDGLDQLEAAACAGEPADELGFFQQAVEQVSIAEEVSRTAPCSL